MTGSFPDTVKSQNACVRQLSPYLTDEKTEVKGL